MSDAKKKPAARSQQNNPEPEPEPTPETPEPVDPEPIPEPEPEEPVVDEGEETEVEPVKAKDFSGLQGEADQRLVAMRANPERKGDPDLTYSAYVSNLLHGHEAALNLALEEAAKVWLKKSEDTNIGEKAKKKLLAYKVLDGQFDRQ